MDVNKKTKITEEEKQRRREDVKSVLANHAIERIYPTPEITDILNKYIEGDYNMDDLIVLIEKDNGKN